MARLSHPNVVTVYEAGTHDGHVFVAMEIIEGQTLAEWIQLSRPSWPGVLDRYLAAGRGLAVVHFRFNV